MRRAADYLAFVAGCLLTVALVLPATGPLGAAVFSAFEHNQGTYDTPDYDLPTGCGYSSESCEVFP